MKKLILLLLIFLGSHVVAQTCTYSSYGPNNWPPAGCSPYAPTSPFNTRIPANPPFAANSAAIISRLIADAPAGSQQFIFQSQYNVAPTGKDCNHPNYFSTSSDPVYTVNSTTCGQSAAWGTVHIPNGALPGQGCSDHHFAVIDKTTNVEHDFYQFPIGGVSGGGVIPHVSACGIENTVDTGSGIGSPVTASAFAEIAGVIRGPELQGNLISHALFATVSCDNGTSVYPAQPNHTVPCNSTANAFPFGSLIWIDYTDAQIAALSIPAWERTIITALAHYGAYIGDQGGPFTASQLSLAFESGQGYVLYGAAQPTQQVAVAAGIPFNSGIGGYLFAFPGVDFASHLHVLDPCIPQGTCPGSGTKIVQVTPNPFTFANTVVGSTTNQLFTLQNVGTANLTITGTFTVTPSTNFGTGGAGGSCFNGQVLTPNATCTASAHFTPTTTGPLSASYNFFTDATLGTYVVPLSGTGIAPAVALIPLKTSNIDAVALDQGITPCPETGTPTCAFGTNCWKWQHDTGTSGTSCGNSSLVSTPSLDGTSREFDVSWTSSGGERFSILTNPSPNLDTTSTAFVYDVTVYVNSLTLVNQLEFDLNQVTSDGNTVIMGTQCNLATGVVNYTSNSSGAHWNATSIPCTRAMWNLAPASNHLIVTYHRDASGNVTYDSWSLNGTTTLFSGATVPSSFSLGWTPLGIQVVNFQLNGSSTTSSTTAYLDQLNIYASAATLTFPNTSVNFTSGPLQVVVLNTGSAPLSISAIAASNPKYQTTDNCPRSPSTLAVQASCRVNVTFVPTAPGPISSLLTITSDAPGPSQTANLQATGIQSVPHSSSTTIGFADTFVGSTTAPQTVTISNLGTGPILGMGIGVSGDFADTTTCGSTLAVGDTCTISFTFTPTVAGNRTGSALITSTDGGPSVLINLGGVGVNPTNGAKFTGGIQITGGVKVLN